MSAHAGQNIVEDGLITCLDLSLYESYPESGSTIYDLMGNHNFTVTNNPSFVQDPVGALALTDSPHTYCYCNDLWSAMGLGNVFTLSMWVSATGYTTSQGGWPFSCEQYLTTGFRTRVNSAGVIAMWSTQSGGTLSGINSAPLFQFDGTKYLLTFTYDGTRGTVYLNDVNVASNTGTIIAPDPTRLNFSVFVNGSAWDANLHKVLIYNRALTADEVRQNYQSQKSKYSR